MLKFFTLADKYYHARMKSTKYSSLDDKFEKYYQ